MENTEIFKGQTEGIILFILSNGDKHTDQIKLIIDEKFLSVKIGTLYSIIARLKTQKLINEYRASSIDGSRRKFYSLTDGGRNVYLAKYSNMFKDIVLEEEAKEEISAENTQPSPNVEESKVENIIENDVISNKEEDKAKTYASYINDLMQKEDVDNIDFSAFEEAKVQQEVNNTTSFNEPKTTTQLDFVPYIEKTNALEITNIPQKPQQNDVDYDSIVSSKYEYSTVLDKLFPKPKTAKVEIFEEENMPAQEPIKEPTPKNPNTINLRSNNWNDVYDLAEKDGIKIKISSDTNRYQGSKILINKLTLATSFISLVFVILSYLIVTGILSVQNVSFKNSQFLTLLIILGSITLISLTAYIICPIAKIKDLPKFINVIEIALIICISTIIISFAISAIQEIDYKNVQIIFDKLIFPSMISLMLPIFISIEYLLSKLEFFQTF